MNKKRFQAYLNRLVELKEARQAYMDAEIEHLRFRQYGGRKRLPKSLEKRLRREVYVRMLQLEISNLKVMNKRRDGKRTS